jgi:acyl-CoA thioesterase-2
MGDLDLDTRVEGSDGHYVGEPSEQWRIWGPMGGYAAAFGLRAAAAEAPAGMLPATMTVQFFKPAAFEPIDISVELRRASRRTAAYAVRLTQEGRAILDCQVWFATEANLIEHDHAGHHGYDGPEAYPSTEDLVTEPSIYPFWENLEGRPCDWVDDWEQYSGGEPKWAEWLKFRPEAVFGDPVLEACRLLIIADLPSFPAATRAHSGGAAQQWMAPNVDLSVQSHRLADLGEWLLCVGLAPVADRGLIGFRSEAWTEDGRLVASGSGQLLTRMLPPPEA